MVYHVIFLGGLFLEYVLNLLADVLNLRSLERNLFNRDRVLRDIFSSDHLALVYVYNRSKVIVSNVQDSITIVFLITFIYSGMFIGLSEYFVTRIDSTIIAHLCFLFSFSVIMFVLTLPFRIYDTFGIEKKFGFSTITKKIFITDMVKSLIISTILGTILVSCIFVFLLNFRETWWMWSWGLFIVFTLIMVKIYPSVIAPLFNKYELLPEGELRTAIMDLADRTSFPLQNVLKSDASKRSKHSNAYFTGIGKNKRVVLFDTILEQLEISELVGVLAHEIGHFVRKHLWITFSIQSMMTGLLLFTISKIIHVPGFQQAFDLADSPFLTKFIFTILFTESFFWIVGLPATIISRRNEFAADEFSKYHCQSGEPLVKALIKMYRDNLGNPYPHPFSGWLFRSHPTLIERVKKLSPD